MIGKDLVPKAIDVYLKNNKIESKIYWNPMEYQKNSNDKDLIILGEIYLKLREKGRDLIWVGEQLYKRGEARGLPGFESKYSNQNN